MEGLARTLLGAESVEAVGEAAVRRIREDLEPAHISVVVFDRRTEQATVVAAFSSGQSKSVGGSRWGLDAFGSLDTPATGGVRLFQDLRIVSPLPPAIGTLLREGVRSLAAVPLVSDEDSTGLLLVGSLIPDAFDATHLELLSGAAPLLASALVRARRFEMAVSRVAELDHRVTEMERGRAEQRNLLAQVALAQEQERQRIAVDIHDDSVQVMTTAALRLNVLRSRLGEGELGELAGEAEGIVREAVRRLRHLMFELIPPALDREGLVAALTRYLNRMEEQSGISHRLEPTLVGQPPAETRAILYRIAQEAVTNVVKHARAESITVSIEERDEGFLIRVSDDGVGFSIDDVESRLPLHLGLTAMRQRAEMAGGWCRIRSQAGSGTSVEAWVPGAGVIELEEPAHRSTSA